MSALYKELARKVADLKATETPVAIIARKLDTSERTVRRAWQYWRETLDVAIPAGGVVEKATEKVVAVVTGDTYHAQPAVELPKVSREYKVAASETSITITHGTEVESITKGNEKFDEVSEVVWGGRGSQESLEKAFNMISLKVQFIKEARGKITIDTENGRVLYKDQPIPAELRKRIVDAANEGDMGTFEGLVAFTQRLYKNTSNTAVMGLYRFLEAANIKIDEDGLVVCYKRVRGNYTDIHSGKFDNSVGTTPTVERWEVDENPNRTCSHGLHVCSLGYLPSFGTSQGNRVIKVLVDPADFVAVPQDYNNAKARVCKYHVIDDVTEAYEAGKL